MKHPHYDMIVAKAANMDLVRFANFHVEWVIQSDCVQESTQFNKDIEYFLCLPQHKDACLHWLNGGDVQIERATNDRLIVDSYENSALKKWTYTQGFMQESNLFRIKPRKEKR